MTELLTDLRGTVFNVTKRCQRFSGCTTRGIKTCEIIGEIQYCYICEEAPPSCPQRTSAVSTILTLPLLLDLDVYSVSSIFWPFRFFLNVFYFYTKYHVLKIIFKYYVSLIQYLLCVLCHFLNDKC